MISENADPVIIDDDIMETLDEDNRLTRDFVDRVLDAAAAGDVAEVRRRPIPPTPTIPRAPRAPGDRPARLRPTPTHRPTPTSCATWWAS